MTIVLEFVNDDNVRRDPGEPGAMFNPSSNIYVQLRALSMAELRQEWKTFDTLLRKALFDLFSMKISEVRGKYGALDIAEKAIKGHDHLEFGLAYSRAAHRFTYLRTKQVVKGLVAIGAVSATTRHGKPRRRQRDADGTAAFVEKLEPDLRLGLIATLLESDASLDELLWLPQTSMIRDRESESILRQPASQQLRSSGSLRIPTHSSPNNIRRAEVTTPAGSAGYSGGPGLRNISRCAESGFSRSRT
jgi:hypothetical protein